MKATGISKKCYKKVTEIFKTGNNLKCLKQETIYTTKLLQHWKSWNRLETSHGIDLRGIARNFKGTQPNRNTDKIVKDTNCRDRIVIKEIKRYKTQKSEIAHHTDVFKLNRITHDNRLNVFYWEFKVITKMFI